MEDSKRNVLANAFNWLFIGLFVAFLTSFGASSSEQAIYTIYGSLGGYGYLVFALLEIVIGVYFCVRIKKLDPTTAKIFYIIYCALTGLSFSGIFIIYTGSSIAIVFLITSILFGIFALIGRYTHLNLASIGIYLLIALIAIIIAEIVNAFIMNNTLNMVIIIISIVVFCIYVAYDVNMLLRNNYLSDSQNESIYFAFQLFIDFINLFIRLLEIFGKRRD